MKAGSNQLKMDENSFLENFAHILFIRDVYGGGNSTTPREVTARGNIRAGGVIPHQITLMSPLSRMTGMDQMKKRLSCLDQWLVLQIHLINPKPSTHGDMGWG